MTGDLELFGLPNLLHSLYHTGVVGTLLLEDGRKKTVGTLQIAEGKLIGASVDSLTGPEALYQLLERPRAAGFRFTSQTRDQLPGAEGPDLLGLLVEGLRRCDELHRAVLLVPTRAPSSPLACSPAAARAKGTCLS